MMLLLSRLFFLTMILLLVTSSVAEEENHTINSSKQSNITHNIFLFSKAIPFADNDSLVLINSSIPNSNESSEAYYNDISNEMNNTPLHLNLLGIPMECHFCLVFRIPHPV